MKRYFIYSFQYTLVGNTSFGFGTASCDTEARATMPGPMPEPPYPSYEYMAQVIQESGPNRMPNPAIISIWEVSQADYEHFNAKS